MRSKTRAQNIASWRHTIHAIVNHRAGSLAVYYNDSCLILFSVDYQKRMEHGMGAS